jgi:hypothetical protein
MDDDEILAGGVANAGAVVRRGDEVLRPANPNTPTIHALLRHVRAEGFDGVPEPLGVDADGREHLGYVPGAVPCPPFPAWSQADEALASTAALLARFHAATAGFAAPPDATWDTELADPTGGALVCHNDVCPENVVFRDGEAVALLDFDFAALAGVLHDLGALARMCVPLDTPDDAARSGRVGLDPFRRLRVVADAYGLAPGRTGLVDAIGAAMVDGGSFVRRRVERGDAAFTAMWHETGGQARYDRRRAWFEANRARFLDALA